MAASRQVVINRMGRHISRSEEVIACHVFAGRIVSNSGGDFNETMQRFHAMMESERGGHVGVAVTARRMLFAQQTSGQWEEFFLAFPEVAHVEYEDALTSATIGVQLKSGVRVTVRGGSQARGELRALSDAMSCALDVSEALGGDAERLLAAMPQAQLTSDGAQQLIRQRENSALPFPCAAPLPAPARPRPPLIEHEAAPQKPLEPPAKPGTVTEQLLQLGAMRQQGFLSEEEFSALKRRLLGL